MLTSDLESPLVPETSVGFHLEESLDIFSEFGFEDVGGHLEIFAFLVISLPVEEPTGDAVSFGFSDDLGDSIGLFFLKFSSSKFGVNSEDFADVEAESSADSLDFIKGVGDGPLSIDVSVEDTVDMLKVVLCVFDHE